jgi:hypothetical protein
MALMHQEGYYLLYLDLIQNPIMELKLLIEQVHEENAEHIDLAMVAKKIKL